MREGRFHFVKYSKDSLTLSDLAKEHCIVLEELIEVNLPNSREKSLALTKLEECFMWIGKAVRSRQIEEIPWHSRHRRLSLSVFHLTWKNLLQRKPRVYRLF